MKHQFTVQVECGDRTRWLCDEAKLTEIITKILERTLAIWTGPESAVRVIVQTVALPGQEHVKTCERCGRQIKVGVYCDDCDP